LCGGDDYRLCFTADAQHDADLQAVGNCFCIGKIIAGSGVVALDSSRNPVQWLSHGYQHF
jgi:thiamine monophosphate kinase